MRNADEETKYLHETNKFPGICRRAAEVGFAGKSDLPGATDTSQSICNSAEQSREGRTESLIATLSVINEGIQPGERLSITRPNPKKAIVRRQRADHAERLRAGDAHSDGAG